MTQQVNLYLFLLTTGLPRWLSGKEFACQGRRHKFDPWVGKIPWRRKWQPSPVCLPGKPMDRGAWPAIVHWVAKSQTLLLLHKDQLCFQRQPPLARTGRNSYHPL